MIAYIDKLRLIIMAKMVPSKSKHHVSPTESMLMSMASFDITVIKFHQGSIYLHITELVDSWDEQLGLKGFPDIFGLWVTESAETIRYNGRKSVGSQNKTSSRALAIIVPVICVSSMTELCMNFDII